MLTEKDVDHIALLARIELTPARRERMRHELSSILDYVEQLRTVATADVEPLYQASDLTDRTRADEHRGDFPVSEELDTLLAGQAPGREGRYVRTKAVLKR